MWLVFVCILFVCDSKGDFIIPVYIEGITTQIVRKLTTTNQIY